MRLESYRNSQHDLLLYHHDINSGRNLQMGQVEETLMHVKGILN